MMLICMGNRPISALVAWFAAFLLTSKNILQNLRCVFSMGVLSQLSKFSFVYRPQTSLPYVRIGCIAVSNILLAERNES